MVQLITNFQHVTLQFTFTCNTYHIYSIYILYVLCDMCLSVPCLQGTYARKFDAFSHRCRTHPRIFQLADRLCLRELKADHVGCLRVFSTKLLRWNRLKPPRKSWALKIFEWFPFSRTQQAWRVYSIYYIFYYLSRCSFIRTTTTLANFQEIFTRSPTWKCPTSLAQQPQSEIEKEWIFATSQLT